ncbi:MAG: hypothetical protein HY909_18475 [Deltaproteobacteria bacterium]|nr:hypothetical protein [Deltaproteobacteria bacterium]
MARETLRMLAFWLLAVACRTQPVSPSGRDGGADAPRAEVTAGDSVVVTLGDVPADTAPLADVSDAPTEPVALRPPWPSHWDRLPVARWGETLERSRWEDAPDLDGDGLADVVVAVDWRDGAVCDDPARCPAASHGELPRLAVAVRLSAERTLEPSAARAGRFVASRPLGAFGGDGASLQGVEFSEFGPGVLLRATVSRGPEDETTVVDVLVGLGLQTHVGSLVHRCRGAGRHSRRTGSLEVYAPVWAPLLWRAALAHPFGGCATDAVRYDQELGALLQSAVVVTVTARSPAPPGRSLTLERAGDVVVAVDLRARTDGAAPRDPLESGPWRVLDSTRGCEGDLLRWSLGHRRCQVLLRRDDEALPGCEAGPSPLDPLGPRVLALAPAMDEAGTATVLLARGPRLFEYALPARCTHTLTATPRPWTAEPPPGMVASPDGASVLVTSNFDLWRMSRRGGASVLLNPPGGEFPRGLFRAVAWLDATTIAAVVGRELVVATVTEP